MVCNHFQVLDFVQEAMDNLTTKEGSAVPLNMRRIVHTCMTVNVMAAKLASTQDAAKMIILLPARHHHAWTFVSCYKCID